jgi:hypothetical protein
MEHRDADIREALEKAGIAFARHSAEWNAAC